MTLFCSGKDSAKEKWDGAKTGLNEAAAIFRADDALSIDQFSAHLKTALAEHSHVYVDIPPTHTRRGPRAASKSVLKYLTPPVEARSDYDIIVDSLSTKRKPLAPEVARLRAIKSLAEQRVMRTAADISGRAHAKDSDLSSLLISSHHHQFRRERRLTASSPISMSASASPQPSAALDNTCINLRVYAYVISTVVAVGVLVGVVVIYLVLQRNKKVADVEKGTPEHVRSSTSGS
ncbi:hypothetical protein DXG03_002489 [Asterophora parasitica]|uniref:Aminopeptidase P N-terminal domain-containing protein n=1 Tax=Asterophora parasitica TaxID=117018 RepID=A0A9P7G4C0_9AGAR|nr:hypothetical protein DXG03_002489 [Asterophora parasitica]